MSALFDALGMIFKIFVVLSAISLIGVAGLWIARKIGFKIGAPKTEYSPQIGPVITDDDVLVVITNGDILVFGDTPSYVADPLSEVHPSEYGEKNNENS